MTKPEGNAQLIAPALVASYLLIEILPSLQFIKFNTKHMSHFHTLRTKLTDARFSKLPYRT